MRLVSSCLAVYLFACNACAYIDPGTGGMIVGGMGGALWAMLVAAFAGVVALVARFYGSIRSWIRGLWKKAGR